MQNTETGKTYGCLKDACKDLEVSYDYYQKCMKKKGGEYKQLKYIGYPKGHKRKCIHIQTGKVFNSLSEGCKEMDEAYNYQIRLINQNKENRKFNYVS